MVGWAFPAAIAVSLVAATMVATLLARLGFPVTQGRRVGHIDGLRGYLALAVLTHHCIIASAWQASGQWASPAMPFYNELGRGGVALFFMVTGLVFYPRVLAGFYGNDWTQVYLGRLFRIVPMLLATIVAATLVVMAESGRWPDRSWPAQAVCWVLGIQVPLLGVEHSDLVNGAVLWSIFYEWQFYLLWLPLCAALRGWVGTGTWRVPLALAAVFVLSGLQPLPLARYLGLFAMGMAAGEVIRHPDCPGWLQSRGAAIAALTSLLGAMAVFHEPFGPFVIPFFGFFFVTVAAGNSLFGLLSTRGALVLGEISYGFYLIHGIVVHLAYRALPLGDVPMLAMPALAMLTTLLAAGGYLLIERPGIALGRRIAQQAAQQRARQAALAA